MSRGNLLDFLRDADRSKVDETLLVHMTKQIADAMSYLESKNFIHRDLVRKTDKHTVGFFS